MTVEPESASRAPIQFPQELPISARVADLSRAIEQHQVVIVAGATGSGKTTQLPKIALTLGRGTEGLIGVTQPRRIAATSVAARVAKELECELGNEVGYQIRFEDRTGPGTYVKFMTDGILLAEIQGDRLLRRYDTLIIDEAHERSLTIDFLLGWLKYILPERPDLKVIISSATLETQRFSEFFGGAPVIEVEGRTFPVDVLYEPPAPELDLAEAVAAAVESVTSLDPRGDVLVFLPGEREIHEAVQELERRPLRHTVVQPLYGRLSAGEQRAVFANIPQRRVILATNVAETSLTIPGIVYVIDAGLARLSRYDPRTGTTRLQIEGISQASADQRKGRCGRVRAGICVRLYDEPSFAARPAFTDPEIRRTGLASVILRMKALRLGAVENFPFLDPPNPRAIAEGYRVLQELAALDDARELTPLGERLSRFPVDPRVARMILAGHELGCLEAVLVLAAALSVQDPRERPRGLEQKADQQHAQFRDERSDFLGLLKLWDFLRDAERRGKSELRRVCKQCFLGFLRVREWTELHRQLSEQVRDVRLGKLRELPQLFPKSSAESDALHRALLTGLLSRIGQYHPEQRVYLGAKQTRFFVHPSSALAKKPPAWLMAFELVQTTQLFARTTAKIDPEWLCEVGEHLLKRSYADPRWSEKSARTSIREHATLFGLQVVKDRSVDYANIDPADARRLFIEHALVRGEYVSRGRFQQKNQQLLEEVSRLRDRARQSDMLADDQALFAFFDQRVPASVVNGKAFERWLQQTSDAEHSLLLSLDDVLTSDQRLDPNDYPDTLTLHGVKLELAYRFEPGAEDDGVRVDLPLALLPELDEGELAWIIPGWHAEQIALLLRDLPRALRKELEILPDLARVAAARLKPFQGELLPSLAHVLFDLTGVRVPLESFRADQLPPHLRLFCRVLGERSQVLAEGRDVAELFQRWLPRALELHRSAEKLAQWERSGLSSWDFGELPRAVPRRVGGVELSGYPALVDRGRTVDLTLLESARAADAASRLGVRRLLVVSARRALSTVSERAALGFPRLSSTPASKSELEADRELLFGRVVEQAFDLASLTELPHNKRDFEDLLARGTPRIAATFRLVADAFAAAAAELDRTLRALDAAAKQPSGRAAVLEIRAQVEQLFTRDVLEREELRRIQQLPRYLRAAQARLTRALADPRKDSEKLAPFSALWASFRDKRLVARDQQAARELRWLFEELRVAIFAQELKPALPVSIASISALLANLR